MPGSPIVVIGSTNTDMVIKAAHLPQPGETILGGTFFMNAGGKGANQAVAAARLGGSVSFIAKTGNDVFGKQALGLFQAEGIDCSRLRLDEQHPSGVALIMVDDKGENCIAVAPGANAELKPADLRDAKSLIEKAPVVLMQLETPVETVEYVAGLAGSANVKTILNPAPARALNDELLAKLSVITPNQKEAEMLTGIKVTGESSALEAAACLRRKGVETVVITMGAAGAFVLDGSGHSMIAGHAVKVTDTTAAGDVFNGALAVGLSEGMNIKEAVSFACRAAAISVTRLGAQASAPYRSEVENFTIAVA